MEDANMLAKWTRTVSLALVIIVVSAGLAMAQAPDQEPGRGEGRGGGRGGRGGRGGGQMRAIMGVAMLLGHEDAIIENTTEGIRVVIEPEDDVDDLQEAVEERVGELREAMAERGAAGRKRGDDGVPGNLAVIIMQGRATVDVENTDDGVVLEITSGEEAVVDKIQEIAPEWQQRAQRMNKMRERMRMQHEAFKLLGDEDIQIETVRTENGVTVRVTTDDPELREEIQELLPEFFGGVGEMRRDRDRDRERDGDDEEDDEDGDRRFKRGRGRGRGRRPDGDKDEDEDEDDEDEDEEEDEDEDDD
jgi:hypothetical protein